MFIKQNPLPILSELLKIRKQTLKTTAISDISLAVLNDTPVFNGVLE